MSPEAFLIGLDLGQSMDPTALAILDRGSILDDAGNPVRDGRGLAISAYGVLHLERYPLNSAYPVLVEVVKELVSRPAVQSRGRPRLAIDATGVGRAVVDQFLGAKMPAEIVPITITSGAGVTRDLWNKTGPICYRVAKLDLVAAVRIGLDAGRLRIAPTLALARTLVSELQTYQVKITHAAHETFNAREGAHDDLVLAVALAAWLGENAPPPPGPCAVAGRRADLVNPFIPRARPPWGMRSVVEDASIWSKMGRRS